MERTIVNSFQKDGDTFELTWSKEGGWEVTCWNGYGSECAHAWTKGGIEYPLGKWHPYDESLATKEFEAWR